MKKATKKMNMGGQAMMGGRQNLVNDDMRRAAPMRPPGMNAGGKAGKPRGYGMAKGGKACKMM